MGKRRTRAQTAAAAAAPAEETTMPAEMPAPACAPTAAEAAEAIPADGPAPKRARRAPTGSAKVTKGSLREMGEAKLRAVAWTLRQSAVAAEKRVEVLEKKLETVQKRYDALKEKHRVVPASELTPEQWSKKYGKYWTDRLNAASRGACETVYVAGIRDKYICNIADAAWKCVYESEKRPAKKVPWKYAWDQMAEYRQWAADHDDDMSAHPHYGMGQLWATLYIEGHDQGMWETDDYDAFCRDMTRLFNACVANGRKKGRRRDYMYDRGGDPFMSMLMTMM